MKNRKDILRLVIEEYWRKPEPEAKERAVKIDLKTDMMADLIGPRRAGKTFSMYLTIKKLLETGVDKRQTIYVNFENRKLFPLSHEYFNHLIEIVYEEDLLEKGNVYFFLDEVQRIDEWEKFVRSIYDEFKGKIKIFVSGSTSSLTSSELSHLLTGRHLTSIILPLSFGEFLHFKDFNLPKIVTEKDKAKIVRFLREYLEFGGFPEIVGSPEKEDLLEALFLDILHRDILLMIRNKQVGEDLAYFLCSYSGKYTSFSKLANTLEHRGIKISVPTLEKYFYLMKDAFLFFDVNIFSYKVKDQLQYPRKIYCIDTGFVNIFGFKFSDDMGRLMENSVFAELLRRTKLLKRKKVFYWKDYYGHEVDFVLKEGINIKQLIQVTYASARDEIAERELKGLVKASGELRCRDLLIVTWDYEAEEEFKGKKIRFVPLWKWLLKY